MDIELPLDFKEFLKLLNEKDVRYLLIGGYAVGYHGYPRATNDMDIWIAVHPENAERIVDVLKEFGFNLPAFKPATMPDRKLRVFPSAGSGRRLCHTSQDKL